ncbi:hypothetical protein D0Z03_001710 [Geotrichum reessii]|nr:hypothetical protein D0Z03_001710 [Galactomyces reessii]
MSTCTMTSQQPHKHSAYSVAPPTSNFQPLRKPARQLNNTHKAFKSSFLPLKSVLPTTYATMYTPDVLANAAQLTSEGRPLFTQRDLVDWRKNDLRSLLIVPKLRREWNGVLPQIIEPGFSIVVLPLDASDEEIIDTLVSSDIYKEHKFEHRFLVQTAQYTVQAARQRNANQPQARMTLPQWRNIIENYLLNLACEAQCRLDFKQTCLYLKKHKQREQEQLLRQQQEQQQQQQQKRSTSPLLKKAIMTHLMSTSPEFNKHITNNTSSALSSSKVSLSRMEKQQIWVHVQTELYARLGLNWEADELI